MSDEPTASLLTLSIQVLHQISDNLDAATIIRSVRNGCQKLREAADTYNRHTLDLSLVSQPDFSRLFDVIPSENVISLTLKQYITSLLSYLVSCTSLCFMVFDK